MNTRIPSLRRNLLRGIHRRHGRHLRKAYKPLLDPRFPLNFLVRNLIALEREPSWHSLLPRMQRLWFSRIIRERCRAFLEVKEWRRVQELLGSLRESLAFSPAEPPGESSYCDHCGGCCEIAGGYPDFPDGSPLPLRWRKIFADGLGKGHRFCAFLWESGGEGRSLCSIHRWRPMPCRIFEEDECRFYRAGIAADRLSEERILLVALRRFLKLVDGR